MITKSEQSIEEQIGRVYFLLSTLSERIMDIRALTSKMNPVIAELKLRIQALSPLVHDALLEQASAMTKDLEAITTPATPSEEAKDPEQLELSLNDTDSDEPRPIDLLKATETYPLFLRAMVNTLKPGWEKFRSPIVVDKTKVHYVYRASLIRSIKLISYCKQFLDQVLATNESFITPHPIGSALYYVIDVEMFKQELKRVLGKTL